MDLKEIVLKIKGDSTSAQTALGNVTGSVNKFGGIVKTVIAGAAVAAVVSFGKSCINAAVETQAAETTLRSSLGNIKGMTDKAKDAAVDWVNKMEASKAFDDAEISAALQRIVIKTGDLGKAQEFTTIAMEVARNKHIDLASATSLLEQAYNGSARGLKQFGVEVDKNKTGMDYLNEIQQKVKGSGDAWAQTMEGQRAIFNTTFGNFQESVGGVLMPIATKFMEVIQPFLQQAMSWITDHLPQLKEVIATLIERVSKGIQVVMEIAGKMWTAIKPSIDVIIETFGPYIQSLGGWISAHMPQIQSIMVGVAEAIAAAFRIVAAVVKGIVDAITWIINNVKKGEAAVSATFSTEGHELSGGRYTNAGVVSPVPHASGGWAGLNGPELALLGERGPEYVTPAGGSPDAATLKAILAELRTLTGVTARVPGGLAAALNGIGRGT